VNSPEFYSLLEQYNIKYIINSANQIYKKQTLSKVKVLNRHTSLLPAYGGIYPVFWQLLHGNHKGGVTLHWIDDEIDKGRIAYQKDMIIDPQKSLFWHYKVAFEISLQLALKAIDDISMNIIISKDLKGETSYFSWPSKKDIDNYFNNGNKIV